MDAVLEPEAGEQEASGILPKLRNFMQEETFPFFRIVLISAILLSVVATLVFFHEDLHNVHFDSKGHQLVARRIFDNLSPGWKQIGAFWLPLPHVIYYPFVHSDFLYFNGLAGTPVSMICFVLASVVLFKIIEKIFQSRFCAFCGTVLYITNPNILYLQSTALTENLSIFFLLTGVYLFMRFAETWNRKYLWWTSAVSVCGIWTRYENWFVCAFMGLLLLILEIKEKRGIRNLLIDCSIFSIICLAAMASTFGINRWTTGHWTLQIDYRHKEFQPSAGSLVIAFFAELYTLGNLISFDWTALAVIAFVLVFRKRFRDPVFLCSLAILAPILTQTWLYWDGHPTRIRYGLMIVPASACFLAYWPQRSRLFAYIFLVYTVYMALFSPFYHTYASELLKESMRDGENRALQADLLWYLKQNDDGTLILAAMGEIAPVLYDLKLPVKRFIHEGAKPHWNDAYTYGHPETVAGWVFLNQDDKLYKKFHDLPEFHRYFALIGRRGTLELYRRTPDEKYNMESHQPHGTIDKFKMPPLPGI